MTPELSITTERIDDFPLLLATMQQIGLPEIIDRHLTRHGQQEGLSWGWIATIWLAHILSQGDHRKLPVQAWVRQSHPAPRRPQCHCWGRARAESRPAAEYAATRQRPVARLTSTVLVSRERQY